MAPEYEGPEEIRVRPRNESTTVTVKNDSGEDLNVVVWVGTTRGKTRKSSRKFISADSAKDFTFNGAIVRGSSDPPRAAIGAWTTAGSVGYHVTKDRDVGVTSYTEVDDELKIIWVLK